MSTQFLRRLPRMSAAPAADVDAEFPGERRQAALQRADHAGGDAGRMPIHPHHGAERLEPERMRQPPQQLVAAIVMDDRLADMIAPRRVMRSASHAGTRPPWSGRSALPAASHQSVSLSIAEAPGRSPAYNMGMHSFAVTEQVSFMSARRKCEGKHCLGGYPSS